MLWETAAGALPHCAPLGERKGQTPASGLGQLDSLSGTLCPVASLWTSGPAPSSPHRRATDTWRLPCSTAPCKKDWSFCRSHVTHQHVPGRYPDFEGFRGPCCTECCKLRWCLELWRLAGLAPSPTVPRVLPLLLPFSTAGHLAGLQNERSNEWHLEEISQSFYLDFFLSFKERGLLELSFYVGWAALTSVRRRGNIFEIKKLRWSGR